MDDALILNLPLRILLGHKRQKKENGEKAPRYFYINMNAYRNADFHTLNNAKIKFKELIESQLRCLPVFSQTSFKYILYPGSNRDMDVSNICSIADKFFSDAFVEAGKIEDDNFNFIPKVEYLFGAVDKNNPRVEVHITGQIKEDQMQLQALLNNDDFEAALEAYVRAHFPMPVGTKPEIAITAGRGDKGYSAVVTFVTSGDTNPKINPDEAVIAAALKEEGSKMSRLGSNAEVMPKATTSASKRAVVEDTPHVPNAETVEALKDVAAGNVQRAETVDSLFQPETVSEEQPAASEEPVEARDDEQPFALSETPADAATSEGPKPLFSFGS